LPHIRKHKDAEYQTNNMMKQLLFVCVAAFAAFGATAQVKKKTPKKDWSKVTLSNRANDHFMMQYGGDSWQGKPDSIRTGGFSRHFNMYVMLDKPFKNDVRYSVAFGAGIGSSNIFFDKMSVDLKTVSNRLPIRRADSIDHFSKYKLTSIYLEAPIELRFSANPENGNKGLKAAIGVKVGTLLSVYTKGKELQNKNGQTLHTAIVKEKNKQYVSPTRLTVTGRVGLGNLSLNAAYQINTVFKDGVAPDMRTFSLGVCLSGL
jgi:hypothetical protein